MKKFTLISGIVAVMLTTASADFSFGEMYEKMKAVATSTTDINTSNNVVVDTDKNSSKDVNKTVVNKEEESIETNTTIDSSEVEVSTDKNISDNNITETPIKDDK